MTTRLTDVFVPEVYGSYTAVDSPEKTAFFQSGVAMANPAISSLLANGGSTVEIPFWNDLDADIEPNISSDDPAQISTPNKVTTGIQKARLANLNQSYAKARLASELSSGNPMQQIRNRFGTYWMRQWQRRTIATLQGVLADNIANDDADMVNDIKAATNADVDDSTLFSRKAFTTAAFTSGDHYDDYNAIAVHSIVYQRMIDNDDIEYIRDSDGALVTRTFMGRTVIVDDGLPVTPAAGTGAGDAAAQYTSYLFGTGLIGYGETMPDMPVELYSNPDGGNGGGVETLYERKSWIIHPSGFAYSGDATGLNDIRNAANWDRVVERKNVPFAALITNG